MNVKALIVVLAVVVAIAIGGGYLVLHKSPTSMQPQSAHSANSQSVPNTIVFNGTMFTPAMLSVAPGTTVTIKNTSSQELQMDSDPHPVHTDDTDLNVGQILPDQSKMFTVTKTGTFGYYDHLDPSIQGKITIE